MALYLDLLDVLKKGEQNEKWVNSHAHLKSAPCIKWKTMLPTQNKSHQKKSYIIYSSRSVLGA